MKVTLKYRTDKGGWKFVKCPCCGLKQFFKSWKKARDYADEAGFRVWKSSRV